MCYSLAMRRGIAFVLPVVLAAACESFDEPARDEPQFTVSRPVDAGAPDTAILAVECVEPPETVLGPRFRVEGCLHQSEAATLAVFEWWNGTGEEREVPYGPDNNVAPGDEAQGQGVFFGIGRSGRFVVPLDESEVTWTILDQAVTVSSTAADCGELCEYWQLAGPDSYLVDTCQEACGDGTCTAGETCHSCAADCDCTEIEPLLDCVIDHGDGRFTASFGFRNAADRAGSIALGPENRFSTGEARRGQPLFFPPGESHDVFQVTSAESEMTWTLGVLSVTATAVGPACADECAVDCSEGNLCIGDSCRASCGNGICTEGNCDECPADCACSPGDVCEGGACGTPPRCGIELYCGVIDSLGVRVDCGECPENELCSTGICRPICMDDGG